MKTAYILLWIVLLSACQHSKPEPQTSTVRQDYTMANEAAVDEDWNAFLAEFPSIKCPLELKDFVPNRRYSIISESYAQKFVQGALQAKPSPKQAYRYVGKLEAPNYWLILIFVDTQGSVPAYYWAQTYSRSGKILDQEVLAGHWSGSCQTTATIQSASLIETHEMGLSDSIMTSPKPIAAKTTLVINESGQFFVPVEY